MPPRIMPFSKPTALGGGERPMSLRLPALVVACAAACAPAAHAQNALPCQEPSAPKTVVLSVNWRAQEGKEGEVADILSRLAPASRAEPGVIAFIVHRSPEDPRAFYLYEQYRDAAAMQAHFDSAHFKDLVLGRA